MRRPLPLRLAAIACAAAAVGVGVGRVLDTPSASRPSNISAARASSPAALVSQYEAETRANPDDPRPWQNLAIASVQAVAAGGDLALYNSAEAAIQRATRLAPDDRMNDVAGGYLALARHNFSLARTLGARAHLSNREDAAALTILVDANIELGRYEEAEQTLDTLLAVRPGLAAYSRLSYLRELRGDIDGARQAFALAETAGAGSAYDVATVAVLRGKLAINHGAVGEAEQAFARARRYVDKPAGVEAGEARVHIAQGRLDEARLELEAAVDARPTAEAAILLGDVYDSIGETDARTALDRFLDQNAADERGAGADVDMEMALVEANRGHVSEALRLARAAYDRRPDNIFTAATLGWALHLQGDDGAALPLVERSVRLGTRDASLQYRAAVVFDANGQRDRAAAALDITLANNPAFSLREQPNLCALATRLGRACPPM